jgi:hypothetical protein
MFPSHEAELSIPKVIHKFIRELCKTDVSRVKGFCPIPNTSPSGKRVDSDNPIPRTNLEFR